MDILVTGDLTENESWNRNASYFGISRESYTASLPTVGLRAYSELQNGNTFSVGNLALNRAEYLRECVAPRAQKAGTEQGMVSSYTVSEEVEEYCRQRRLRPAVLLRAGYYLTSFAVSREAALKGGVAIRQAADQSAPKIKIGRVDFSVSPINMLNVDMKHLGRVKQLGQRLATIF